MVFSGSSELSASCRTKPIFSPRTLAHWASESVSPSRPNTSSRSACVVWFEASSPSNVRTVTDFPDPDSPTIPTVSPGAIENEIPEITSRCVAAPVRESATSKPTRRFSTRTRGAGAASSSFNESAAREAKNSTFSSSRSNSGRPAKGLCSSISVISFSFQTMPAMPGPPR